MWSPADENSGEVRCNFEALEEKYAFALGFVQDCSSVIPQPEPGAGHSHCAMRAGTWHDGVLYIAELSGRIIKWTVGEGMEVLYHPELKFVSSLFWNQSREAFVCLVSPPKAQPRKAGLFEIDMNGSLRLVESVIEGMTLPYGASIYDGNIYICDACASTVHAFDCETYEAKGRISTPGLTPSYLQTGFDSLYMVNAIKGQGVVGLEAGQKRQGIYRVDFDTGRLEECLVFYSQYSVCDFVINDDALYVLTESNGRVHYIHKYNAQFESIYRVNLTELLGLQKTYLLSLFAGQGRLFVSGYGQTPILVELLTDKNVKSYSFGAGDIWKQG